MFFNIDDFLESEVNLDEEGMAQMPVEFDTGDDFAVSDISELPLDGCHRKEKMPRKSTGLAQI